MGAAELGGGILAGFLKSLIGERLIADFNASARYRVHIYDRPGEALNASKLELVKEQCRTIVSACLDGEELDYGLFAEDEDIWNRTVITVVIRRSDKTPIAFNAMPLLDVTRAGNRDHLLHLGLVMVDPAERSGGVSWILYGLTCFALFLKGRMRPLWISSVTQVPAVVGMVAETFSSVYPGQQGTSQKFVHSHLAHQIMQRHRSAFGVSEDAGFDPTFQIITDAYTGGSDNLKKTRDEAPKHRSEEYNAFCAEHLNYSRGDDVLQIGALDLAAGQRFLSRSVPKSALPQLAVQAIVLAAGATVAPLVQWLDSKTPHGRLRASS